MKTVDIIGYEGLYTISEDGTVTSLKSGRMLTHGGGDGYRSVTLGRKNRTYMHRLLATAFIPNPKNLPCVNHINGIKNDNRLCNLEWISYSDNQKHAYKYLGKIAPLKGKHGKDHHKSKSINQVNKNGQIVNTYESARDAMIEHNITRHWISKGLKEGLQINGYFWQYAH